MLSTNLGGLGAFPGLTLKAWALVKGDGTLVRGFNVTSITKGGSGVYTLNFTAAMSATTYATKITLLASQPSTNSSSPWNTTTKNTGTLLYQTRDNAAAAADGDHYIEVWE